MVDCGGTVEGIRAMLKNFDFWPDHLLLTHGHIDHILALPLFSKTDTKVYIHKNDAHFLSDPNFNLSTRLIGTRFVWDHVFFDYDELPKDLGIDVIHTPGHTPGSVCLAVGEHLFSGDTLFCDGIGNTIFPGGDYDMEIQSIQDLFELPLKTAVYPGHGPSTTIEAEKNTI